MKNLLFNILFISFIKIGFSQSLEIGFNHNIRLGNNGTESSFGYNGNAFQLGYWHDFKKVSLSAGFLQGFNPMCNYSAIDLGVHYPIYRNKNLRILIGVGSTQSVLLFYDNPIYQWNVNCILTAEYKIGSKTSLVLQSGLAFVNAPGYKAYSEINTYYENLLQFRFRYYFGMDKKKPFIVK